jgi:hypothetical protein
LIVLAHFIADFPLQSKRMAKQRSSGGIKNMALWNLGHAILHFIITAALLYGIWSWNIILFIFIISAFHFVIDFSKSVLILKKPFLRYSIWVFIADQFLHIAFIYGLPMITYAYGIKPQCLDNVPLIIRWISYSGGFAANGFEFAGKIVLVFLLLIIGLWGIGVFINIVYGYLHLKPYKSSINMGIIIEDDEKDKLTPDISYWVGILERLLVICSIAVGLQEVVGFVLATKSVARFKEFDDREFVVTFIIGSFISFLSAIVIGVIIRGFNIFPVIG